MIDQQRCDTCSRSWTGSDGRIHCGAGVGYEEGDPIWAERKYGDARMLALLTGAGDSEPVGMDCENMAPDDGAACKIWGEKS
jgi:hypothetical protein